MSELTNEEAAGGGPAEHVMHVMAQWGMPTKNLRIAAQDVLAAAESGACRAAAPAKATAELDRLRPVTDQLLAALKELVAVIEAAGLHNLTNGVQLGPTVWYVKASDAISSARAAITAAEQSTGEKA